MVPTCRADVRLVKPRKDGYNVCVDGGEIQASSLDGCRIDLAEAFEGFAGEEAGMQGATVE
ncbi:MAG: hypothetical protein LBB86_07660 [Oscillospiraceae bacterium]|jgi:hypothetical protein|nr:hypothetical protein [Oscillospiraceae bacterium]